MSGYFYWGSNNLNNLCVPTSFSLVIAMCNIYNKEKKKENIKEIITEKNLSYYFILRSQ